ncbi:MAG: hypothetical protein ACRD2D_01750, partial [Terriglobales bacterium]
LIDRTDAAQKQFGGIQAELRPGGFGEGPVAPGIGARLNNAAGAERRSLSAPTQTSVDDVAWAATALDALMPRLRQFASSALPQLEAAFTAAGAPVPPQLP